MAGLNGEKKGGARGQRWVENCEKKKGNGKCALHSHAVKESCWTLLHTCGWNGNFLGCECGTYSGSFQLYFIFYYAWEKCPFHLRAELSTNQSFDWALIRVNSMGTHFEFVACCRKRDIILSVVQNRGGKITSTYLEVCVKGTCFFFCCYKLRKPNKNSWALPFRGLDGWPPCLYLHFRIVGWSSDLDPPLSPLFPAERDHYWKNVYIVAWGQTTTETLVWREQRWNWFTDVVYPNTWGNPRLITTKSSMSQFLLSYSFEFWFKASP